MDTEDGLNKALKEGKELKKAFEKLEKLKNKPGGLAPYAAGLATQYQKDGPFTKQALDLMTARPDVAFKDGYIAAIKSGKENDVRLAALSTAKLELNDKDRKELASAMVGLYESTPSDDVKLIVLQAGETLADVRFQDIAIAIFEKNPGQAPIANFRAACKLLRAQPTVKAVPTLLRAMFYIEGPKRIVTDCKQAILAAGKGGVPMIINMLQGKDESVNNFIKLFEETYTPQSVVTAAAELLGDLGATDAVPVMLEVLSDPTPIKPPNVLINMDPSLPETQSQRTQWAESIGLMGQEIVLNISEIGVAKEHEEKVKTALFALFRYEAPFPDKFREAVRLKSLVEVSLRVNAVRVLAEQKLIDQELLVKLLDTLGDPEWKDESKIRPAVLATLVTDVVSYLAITSQPDWIDTAYKFFVEMGNKQLNNKSYKKTYIFEPPRDRIADVKPAFELAKRCADKIDCYLTVLEDANANSWELSKAVYEIGVLGKPEHAKILIAFMQKAEAATFVPDYVAFSLSRIGTAADVPEIEKALAKLKDSQSATNFGGLKGKYTPLLFSLKAKGK